MSAAISSGLDVADAIPAGSGRVQVGLYTDFVDLGVVGDVSAGIIPGLSAFGQVGAYAPLRNLSSIEGRAIAGMRWRW